MNVRSPNKWQELATSCRNAHSLAEVDAAICKQIMADTVVFKEVPPIMALRFGSIEDMLNIFPDLLPGSSYAFGYTSDDHEDGEEAPTGYWATFLLGWQNDSTNAPEDGCQVNGRKDGGLALAEVFCEAVGFVVEAVLERA